MRPRRHRDLDPASGAPDQTPAIRGWFADAGFEELAFDSPGEDRFAVGTHRLVTEPLGFRGDLQMFSFIE